MDILVVDDDALSLRLLVTLVEKLGHRASPATDGLMAWEIYRRHPCGVVISDWNMPGLDGIDKQQEALCLFQAWQGCGVCPTFRFTALLKCLLPLLHNQSGSKIMQ